MAVGSGLGTHIKDAYRFLMQNYRHGDKICLLGFSRGAYTVRCLAGMLHKVGLLPASNRSQVNFAYDFYKDETDEGKKLAEGFKHTFCTHVDVYFLGLWDCVASVGFFPRKLPLSKSPPANTVRFVRHAMALDERRAKFKVCQWNQDDPGAPAGLPSASTTLQATKGEKQGDNASCSDNDTMNSLARRHDEDCRHRHDFDTDVLEVWFKGAHADVGGGSVENEARHMLSRIPLRWMIRQCFECNTGILFDTERLAQLGLDVHGLYPKYQKLDRSELDRGGGQPDQRLMRKYKQETLAPLDWRSAVLNIEREGRKDDGKSAPKQTVEDQAAVMDKAQYILPSEVAEDYFDSRQEPCDMLRKKRMWWIVEIWPVKIRVLVQNKTAWAKKVRLNLGRHRAVRETRPHLHWTVQRLIDNEEYKIQGRRTNGTVFKDVV
ncbi:uncharacterized protein B0I36DRAFT_278318 [Microdochium trichocladiopsis]|uniref:T6SS Phospholipase effector Tle1-like catalytic domain-containing protein n=1 Tax=Microdochium trichocladiopsis TaxID=1682393 RepID=A0A9P8XU89_9PEZI|nr:uncharacterized protein B0I36DRAFT_278318 [Microdochium trichocladiopsis]KAH7014434.1 hypothetical protein B0I36DRAFT_278318 [Microdochium trichocladiopsis]